MAAGDNLSPRQFNTVRWSAHGPVHQDGRELHPDDEIHVFHGTSSEQADYLRRHGAQPGGKPPGAPVTRVDSEAVAQMLGKKVGDALDYEPGRGQGAGLYVSPTPQGTEVFGKTVLPVRVRVADLATPPERSARRLSPLKSLFLGDGYVEKPLSNSAFERPL